jgi:hypothetical protein
MIAPVGKPGGVPELHLADPDGALRQILEWLEEHIDLAHTASVEDRYVHALNWEPVDHPPLVLSGPVPQPLAIYPYSQAFRDPTKMLVNELVGPYGTIGPSPSIVNSVLIKDDYPLQIRAFYGVGLFVSLFGVESEVVGENYPWVRPIGLPALKQLVTRGVPDLRGGLFQRALETMAHYKEALAAYPKCRQAIHITQPDLQGIFENAAHLWGSDIFTAFYDCPDLLRELLDLLAETWIRACRRLAADSTQSARDDCIYLHFGLVKGKAMLKEDSCVMLSPKTYAEFIRPANEKVLAALGGAGIHWCGNGDQWRAEVVETRQLTCLDWGQPSMLDLPAWAATLQEHRLPVSQMQWPLAEFLAHKPMRLFPTGAAFTITLDDFGQADEVRRSVAADGIS